MPIITLTTDFGTADWFVGSMKGVMLGINPQATIVDITHEIPAGDIRAGALVLAKSFAYFPSEAIHVAVVDPGVGSKRAAIIARTWDDRHLIGPDNGVLSMAFGEEPVVEIRRLENRDYFSRYIDDTFHGRDIFAPVAAHLANGVPMTSFGPEVKEFVKLPWPEPATGSGEIVYIDHFGNCITNITSAAGKVHVAGRIECPVRRIYQDVAPGQPVALIGSTGFLEIAVNAGHAARQLGLKVGDPVEVN